MTLGNTLMLIELKNDWKAAIQLLDSVDESEPECYLRIMFLLLDFVVEGQYSSEEHDYAARYLKEVFEGSRKKFANNPEYLFFSGVMAHMGEWYFGMDSIDEATTMLEYASKLDTGNSLYRWGYYSQIDQRLEVNTELKLQLSEQLLFKESVQLDWLRERGLLGRYVLGLLEQTYEDLKKQ